MQPLLDNVVVGRYAIESPFVTSARLECRTSAFTRQKQGTSAPVVACDLGVTSGRVFAGWFDDAGFRCTEVHRFSNGSRMVGGELRWDVEGLWVGIRTGISAARGRGRGTIREVAVDAWCVGCPLLSLTRCP